MLLRKACNIMMIKRGAFLGGSSLPTLLQHHQQQCCVPQRVVIVGVTIAERRCVPYTTPCE